MMEIRPLLPSDAEAAVALRRLALTTDAYAFAERPESDPALDLDFVRERLAASSVQAGAVVVGAFEPRLIGVLGVHRLSGSDSARLWGFYVAPTHRAHGIGRALMAAALDSAKQMIGIACVELSVAERSVVAIRIYEAAGFVTTATVGGKRQMIVRFTNAA